MSIQMQAIGRVDRDPQLHLTPDGTPVTSFSLVVNTKRCVEDITVWLFCFSDSSFDSRTGG